MQSAVDKDGLNGVRGSENRSATTGGSKPLQRHRYQSPDRKGERQDGSDNVKDATASRRSRTPVSRDERQNHHRKRSRSNDRSHRTHSRRPSRSRSSGRTRRLGDNAHQRKKSRIECDRPRSDRSSTSGVASAPSKSSSALDLIRQLAKQKLSQSLKTEARPATTLSSGPKEEGEVELGDDRVSPTASQTSTPLATPVRTLVPDADVLSMKKVAPLSPSSIDSGSPESGLSTQKGPSNILLPGAAVTPAASPASSPYDEQRILSTYLHPGDVGYTGCRAVQSYRKLNDISEGTFGVVYRAEDIETKEIFAIKQIKKEHIHAGFPVFSLREINVLLTVRHPNIVLLREIVVDPKRENIFMVMEYMDHDMRMLLRQLSMKHQNFRPAQVKCLLLQLLRAVDMMHQNWIFHRDLKTSNLLLNNKGMLKVCDFGLARQYGEPLGKYSPAEMVVTLAYRAPELLLGTKTYGAAVDMWSVGCIFAEFLSNEPIFKAQNELEAFRKIVEVLGTPTEDIWPGFSNLLNYKTFMVTRRHRGKLREKFPARSFVDGVTLSDTGFDLLSRMLTYDPEKRITAAEALRHRWFEETPLPTDPSMMPTYPSMNEDKSKRNQAMESPADDMRVRREHMFDVFYQT